MSDDGEWFTLAELTQRLGGLVWVEEQLFEIVGRWSTVEDNHRARIVLSETSRHHGWHAQVARACLPTSPQLEPEAHVLPPTSGWADTVEIMAGLTRSDQTSTRLIVLERVVDPWLRREVEALRDCQTEVADRAIARWLRFISLDHHDDAAAVSEVAAGLSDEPVRLADHSLVSHLSLA